MHPDKLRILVVIGTRPEAIKLAPVILAATARPEVSVTVCSTGQHADMVRNVLGLFGITPHWDLAIMKARQTLTDITCGVLAELQSRLPQLQPHWIVVQGDTTTAFAAALAGFYHKIPVAHVEAGLRTGDIYAPWPEEMNRRLIGGMARWHFAPMPSNAANLRREGVDEARIRITGNTGIDALKWLVARLEGDDTLHASAQAHLDATGLDCLKTQSQDRLVLITGHRRESFGDGFRRICAAVRDLARRFPQCRFVYPVHPNPAVRDTVFAELGEGKLPNIHLIDPLDYLPFVLLMSKAEVILTDSGGVQEEAPSLGKCVVVMRDVTERTEGIGTGLIRLAGTDRDKLVADVSDALTGTWKADASARDVYGDGHAASQIIAALISTPQG